MYKRCLFIVEDNEELVAEITELAEEEEWDVQFARCVEDGIAHVKTLSINTQLQTILVLIDLMLPKSKSDLEKLDEIMKQREQIIIARLTSSGSTDLTAKVVDDARRELDKIDKEIRELTPMDSGIEFLNNVRKEITEWKIAVFSARNPDHLKDKIHDIVGDRLVDWLQKPITPDRVINLLQKVGGDK